MKLKDKVALITGGSSGIGRAAALAMAREGAKIALTARRAERCQEAVDEIEGMGGETLVAATVERWGRLDIVVPNAGINGVFASIEDITPEEWDQTQNINVRGTFLTVKYAIPHLRAAGAGSIVVVSSVNGNRIFSNFGFTSYSCSKAAQVTLAKMAAVELAQWDIRINVVCPGWTKTSIGENTFARDIDKIKIPREYPEGMVPLQQRPASSEEVANAILFLASNDASYVTGTEIYVDGALSLFQG